jgi:hypothetical protein
VYYVGTSFGAPFKLRKAVTTTLITGGHKYYYINGYYHYRVDSLSANVYQYYPTGGCAWSNNERMIDSLSMRLNDTAWRNCGTSLFTCIDTNIRTVFGTQRRTKHFRYYGEGNVGNVYARDIGIISAYGGTGQNLYGMELLGCVIDGVVYGDTSMLTGISQISSEVPDAFSLSQNYPNPFNPMTKLRFGVMSNVKGQISNVRLTVYDALGKEVEVLVNQQLSPGTYEVEFDGSDLPSGVYNYRLDASASLSITYTETRKMVLIK